jgi:hypothetical protein
MVTYSFSFFSFVPTFSALKCYGVVNLGPFFFHGCVLDGLLVHRNASTMRPAVFRPRSTSVRTRPLPDQGTAGHNNVTDPRIAGWAAAGGEQHVYFWHPAALVSADLEFLFTSHAPHRAYLGSYVSFILLLSSSCLLRPLPTICTSPSPRRKR